MLATSIGVTSPSIDRWLVIAVRLGLEGNV